MQKNLKTLAASAVCLLVVLIGGMMWTKSSQHNDVQEPLVAVGQPTPDPRAQGLSIAANYDMVQRNYTQAVEKYRQSLAVQPNPDNQISLAMALLKVDRRPEAIQLIKEVADGQSHAKQSAARILGKVERDPTWGTGKR